MSLCDVTNALEKIKNAMFVGETLTLANWAETELTSIQHYLIETESNRLEFNHLARTEFFHIKRVAGMIANFVDMLAHTHMKHKERKIPFCWLANWSGVAKLRIAHEKIKQTKPLMNLTPETYLSVGSAKTKRCPILIIKQLRFDYPIFVKNNNVVGFNGHMDEIFRFLTLQGNHNRHCVIPIVGMGGIGKTTLARLVFNHSYAREHYNAFAWLTFSHGYSINSVLKTLAKEICYLTHIRDRLDQLQEADLRDIVSQLFMKQNKCLVVLDDVQSVKIWTELQMLFPKRASGLRIILTTRNLEVARHAGSSPSVEIQHLSDKQSYTLLHSMIFQGVVPHGCIEPHMEEFVRNLVKKCYGLPLALKTLDCIVRHSSRPWSNLVECFEWESEPEGQACLDIMAISYKSLTNHWMQSFFLYISTFPIGISISVSKLVRLCIAEGFIPKCKTRTLEATARCFIDELIQRCLIQVVTRKGVCGRVKKICMHPIIRESCIRVARKEHVLNFICDGGTYKAVSNASDGNNCRMVLQIGNDKVKRIWYSSYFQEARTVLGIQQNFNAVAGRRMISHFPLLRVLDLQNSGGLENVDLAVGKLVHLKYLGLRNTSIKSISSSIINLINLQTLDARGTSIRNLPTAFWKIQSLKYIFLNNFSLSIPKMHTATNLVCLHIKNISLGGLNICKPFLDLIRKQKELKSLTLASNSELPIPTEIFGVLSNNFNLCSLKLTGILRPNSLPNASQFAPNLTEISLEGSCLEEDPMIVLETLPKLTHLNLGSNAYKGSFMSCSRGGFPKLAYLEIFWKFISKGWRIEIGSMSCLEYLTVKNCYDMEEVPQEIYQLEKVKELHLLNLQPEVQNKIEKNRIVNPS